MTYTGTDFSDNVDPDIRDAFDQALGSKPGASSGEDLPMVWFADVEPNLDDLWLIDGLLPRAGIALT